MNAPFQYGTLATKENFVDIDVRNGYGNTEYRNEL